MENLNDLSRAAQEEYVRIQTGAQDCAFFQSIADLWYILKLGKFGSVQNQFQKTKTNANKEE